MYQRAAVLFHGMAALAPGHALSNVVRVASTRSEGDWEMRTDVGHDQQKPCQISVSPTEELR